MSRTPLKASRRLCVSGRRQIGPSSASGTGDTTCACGVGVMLNIFSLALSDGRNEGGVPKELTMIQRCSETDKCCL